jgi:hypothetical protein
MIRVLNPDINANTLINILHGSLQQCASAHLPLVAILLHRTPEATAAQMNWLAFACCKFCVLFIALHHATLAKRGLGGQSVAKNKTPGQKFDIDALA